MMLIKL